MDSLGEWLPEGLEQPSNLCSTQGSSTPIVIDFGSAQTRVGLASQDRPAHSFLTRAAKFRDRRSGEQRVVVGNDILLEQGARTSARSPFDGPLLTNWDAAESVLDYSFGLIGYKLEDPSPVAISEALLAPQLPHRTLQELLFEGYGVPRVAFGADVLGAANYTLQQHHHHHHAEKTTEKDLLMVFIGAEVMHIVPVLGGKPRLEDAKRINWGGRLASEFLHELLVLKYPSFPVPVTAGEVEQMLRKHCFVATDYRDAVRKCMDVVNLAQLERRVQAPLPERAPLDKERLEQQAERRRESGRRLQEQAAIARAERQERQQQELDQLTKFESELSGLPPAEAESHARAAGFANMVDVRRTVRQLNNTLRRARGEQIEDPEPNTPLLQIPDDQLDSEQIKEKRRQRLLRASYDARQRAKVAKEAQQQAAQAAEAAEAEWRRRDLRGWANAKRRQLDEVLAVIREREKLRRDPRLRFRQTLIEVAPEPKRRNVTARSSPAAPQANAANAGTAAASTNTTAPSTAATTAATTASPEIATGPPEVAENGSVTLDQKPIIIPERAATAELEEDAEEVEEEERDYDAEASALQALLLEHDPEFSLDDLTPQKPWHESTIHKFLWGAHALDPDDTAQQYQLNLNIERMRAVEPIFQPSIVGVDQAGLSEVVAELLHRFPQLASHIQISGGFAHVQGLKERLKADLRRDIPSNVEININISAEPELDAWRGIAEWSKDPKAYVSRKEYEENGPDFIKEHQWGNPLH